MPSVCCIVRIIDAKLSSCELFEKVRDDLDVWIHESDHYDSFEPSLNWCYKFCISNQKMLEAYSGKCSVHFSIHCEDEIDDLVNVEIPTKVLSIISKLSLTLDFSYYR